MPGDKLFPTSLVGSYPQPDWLIDRAQACRRWCRACGMDDLWLVAPKHLEAKQDEATLLAIRDQERAGLDIITDGEQRRESYSNRFATALEGVDIDNPGTDAQPQRQADPGAAHHRQDPAQAPGRAARRAIPAREHREARKDDGARPLHDVEAGAERFLQDDEALALDYAAAVNAEIKDLFAAGADIVQIDEPWMQQHPDKARDIRPEGARPRARRRHRHGRCASVLRLRRRRARQADRLFVPARARGLERGASLDRGGAAEARSQGAGKACHRRPSSSASSILSDMTVETPEIVAERIRKALATCAGRAHRDRARLRHEISAARRRLRENAGDGGGRGHCPAGAGTIRQMSA